MPQPCALGLKTRRLPLPRRGQTGRRCPHQLPHPRQRRSQPVSTQPPARRSASSSAAGRLPPQPPKPFAVARRWPHNSAPRRATARLRRWHGCALRARRSSPPAARKERAAAATHALPQLTAPHRHSKPACAPTFAHCPATTPRRAGRPTRLCPGDAHQTKQRGPWARFGRPSGPKPSRPGRHRSPPNSHPHATQSRPSFQCELQLPCESC